MSDLMETFNDRIMVYGGRLKTLALIQNEWPLLFNRTDAPYLSFDQQVQEAVKTMASAPKKKVNDYQRQKAASFYRIANQR